MTKFPNIIRIEEIERRFHEREGEYNTRLMNAIEKKIEEEKDKLTAEEFELFKQNALKIANKIEYWVLFKDQNNVEDVMAFDIYILDVTPGVRDNVNYFTTSLAINSPEENIYIVIEDVEMVNIIGPAHTPPAIARLDEADKILKIVNFDVELKNVYKLKDF